MKRKTVAVLFDYLEGDYQTRLRLSMEETARRRDINLLLFVGRPLNGPSPADAAQNVIYERLMEAPIDGVVIAAASLGAHVGAAGLGEFARRLSHLPCCSVSMELPGIPSLVVDNRRGTQVVLEHLIEEHGCRRIAYVRGPPRSNEATERHEAFLATLAAHGIEADPKLIDVGDFWVDAGAAAAQRILDRGVPFDAVVAANDHMAFGVLDALRARGIRAPHDVLVAGFDDVPSSRSASPSLTTVRQPLTLIGEAAVDTILMQLDGEHPPPLRRLGVELVTRQSCGCGYHRYGSRASDSRGPPATADRPPDLDTVRELMRRCVTPAARALGHWDAELMQALEQESSRMRGKFLLTLEDILERAQPDGALIEQFHDVIGVLREHFGPAAGAPAEPRRDDLWYAASGLIATARARSEARDRLSLERAQEVFRRTVERVSTALGHAALSRALHDALRGLDMKRAVVSLYEDGHQERLYPLFVLDDALGETPSSGPFEASALAPPGLLDPSSTWSHVVLPLTFGTEQLGVALFESGQHVALYRMLREQIGAGLKAAALHRALVHEARARERAELGKVQKELEIARCIQIAILPKASHVDGLELAGLMLPAADVGGDYYDIVPVNDGCWLGIGDVSGHGLFAGLIMLMLQSMVSSLARSGKPYTPSAMFNAVNTALWDGVRNRLADESYATLLLLRYERCGKLTFAGCHEDLVICRQRTGRCEIVPTSGVWACAVRDVTESTHDTEVTLDDGDLLVLYTDGITEAMNRNNEPFGLEHLCALVERLKDAPVDVICKAITGAVQDWAPLQRDDLSVVIGRYASAATCRPTPSLTCAEGVASSSPNLLYSRTMPHSPWCYRGPRLSCRCARPREARLPHQKGQFVGCEVKFGLSAISNQSTNQRQPFRTLPAGRVMHFWRTHSFLSACVPVVQSGRKPPYCSPKSLMPHCLVQALNRPTPPPGIMRSN